MSNDQYPTPPYPPPYDPPRSARHVKTHRLRRVVLWTLGIIVALAVALTIIGSLVPAQDTATATPAATPHHAASPAYTPAAPSSPAPAAPSPEAKGSGSFDYSLSDSLYGQDYVTAEVTVTNTGNVGEWVTIHAHWHQFAMAPITATRTVRLPVGTARDVRIKVPVSTSQIDNLQTWEEHNNYGQDGGYRLTIPGTFGQAQA